MNWIEISLETDGEAAEAIADLLQQYGYQGVVIEQVGVGGDAWEYELPPPTGLILRAYLPDDEQFPELQRKLETGLYHLGQIYPVPQQPTYRRIPEENWAEAWKVHYHPLHVGRHIYIRPAWVAETPRPGDVEIILDPGVAFGSGTHPSTQLCLLALESLAPLPARVLDLGCGSGILAIAAARLSAGHVWALDIDSLAIRATTSNAALNDLTARITAQEGSLDSLLNSSQRFDLIVVNILAKTIIPMCEQGLGHIVQSGGLGIFSGLIQDQADDVEAALHRTGLIPYRRHIMGDWVGIQARRDA